MVVTVSYKQEVSVPKTNIIRVNGKAKARAMHLIEQQLRKRGIERSSRWWGKFRLSSANPEHLCKSINVAVWIDRVFSLNKSTQDYR